MASPPFGWYSLCLPTKGVDLGGCSHTEINIPHRELNPDTVTHLSTDRARHWLTSLIKANMLTHYARPPGMKWAVMRNYDNTDTDINSLWTPVEPVVDLHPLTYWSAVNIQSFALLTLRCISYAWSLRATWQRWWSHHSICGIQKPHATRKLHNSMFYRTGVIDISQEA